MGYYGGWGRWAPYVSASERKRKAAKKTEQLRKQGKIVNPISLEGRTITKTYWGKSWCQNLESYSDFANRLPRGRTYVRNGSVIDLKIATGSIEALVSGSDIYKVNIDIAAIAKTKWQKIVRECSGKIDSLVELLKGQFSKSVMEIIARKDHGLFPHPNEIKMKCSCPDYAAVCKHIAAVFYGIGARFDTNPELLFTLRQVDHNELIVTSGAVENLVKRESEKLNKSFTGDELSDLFGIDVDLGAAAKDIQNIEEIEDKSKKTQQSYKTTRVSPTKKILAKRKLAKTKEKKQKKSKRIVKTSTRSKKPLKPKLKKRTKGSFENRVVKV